MPGRAARPAAKSPPKAKAPAKKSAQAIAKKAAQKAPVKKAPVKKAPVKKAPPKKAPPKKAPPKKAPAKKAAQKAPVKKAPVKKAPVKKAPVKKAPIATKGATVSKPKSAAPVQKASQAAPKPKAPTQAGPSARKPTKTSATRESSPPPSTPARDALNALAAKRAITLALMPHHNDSTAVDAYFRDLDHPFKAEMEAVRAIVRGVSPKLSERIKWNAPSFFYKEDLGAFNPRATEYAHLILLFPGGGAMDDDDSGILEGNHKDRREVKFHSIDDVKAKKPILEKIIGNWLELRDA